MNQESTRQDGERIYLCIDLKTFYASVECVDRGLNTLVDNLVVADITRGRGTICLAITAAMKRLGIRNRCRIFEIPTNVRYTVAQPRMRHYMEVSAQIYGTYLEYVSPEDIHVYSVDECFIDATPYLSLYSCDARTFALELMGAVKKRFGILATAGIGTNLFLAKVALDITAKHAEDGIGVLDEELFRQHVWDHRPITDIWGIGPGMARRLERLGAFDLKGVTQLPEEVIYKEFGVNAEYLIDHAWGWEPVTMEVIKQYRPSTSSLSSGQVLHCPYDFEKGRLIVREMTELLALDLVRKRVVTRQMVLDIGYDRESLAGERGKRYAGEVATDRYGRKIPRHAHGTGNIGRYTSSTHALMKAVLDLYDRVVDRELLIRRVNITACDLIPEDAVPEDRPVQLDMFTDYEAVERAEEALRSAEERERRLQQATLAIQERFGKNAMLKGMNLMEGGTTMERNGQIGGHKAGDGL